MSNVVDLAARRPHLVGGARCLHCKHTWNAVTPIGVYDKLQCPTCSLFTGVRATLINVPEGAGHFVCTCENYVYELSTAGPLCILCGNIAVGYMREFGNG